MGAAERGLPHVALAIGALHNTSGGAERVLVDVANALHRRGHPVTVITYQDRNGPTFYPLDFGIVRLDGRQRHSRRRKSVPLTSLRAASTRRPLVAALTWIPTYVPRIVRLFKMLRVARPDVAIGFMPSTFPYLVVAAKLARVPSIASIHNVPERELGGDPQRWDQNMVDIAVRRWSVSAADAVTVLLPSFAEQLPDSIRERVHVIPNMIPRYRGRKAIVGEDEANRIVAVGRLAVAKDHATLIKAWALIEADFPNWRVEIYGTGPLWRDTMRLIEDTGVERLTIEDPTPAIFDVYTTSKFLVMPSIHEGFGLVTAEALSCGLPVIGFADCEGTNEIVVDGVNGRLVEPGHDRVEALAAAIRSEIEDESARISHARQAPDSIAQFDPSVVMQMWTRMIDEVARRPRRG